MTASGKLRCVAFLSELLLSVGSVTSNYVLKEETLLQSLFVVIA